jgi:hypothetical protein
MNPKDLKARADARKLGYGVEPPGPPPRRHLTPAGRRLVALAIIIPAALATCTLIFNPI